MRPIRTHLPRETGLFGAASRLLRWGAMRWSPTILASAGLLLAGCGGSVDGGPAGPDTDPAVHAIPGPATLPRLTAEQYRSTLEGIFGEDLPATPVERDTNPYLFFTIGAASTTLSEVGAQQYEENAHRIASFVMDDPARRDAVLGCTAASLDDVCSQRFLTRVGRLLARRPLTGEELARWTAIAVDLGEGDVHRGLRYALAGMLQAPSFLYRAELGFAEVGVPEGGTPTVDRATLDGFEVASRLAFLLWNTGPDDALLDAAAAGELDTPEGIHERAWQMIEDPRARRATMQFFAQYLDLGRLTGLDRDVALYPTMTPTLARSMRTEIELLVDDLVFRRDADVRELLRTRRTFVNAELATLYGVEAPGATPISFVAVELPEDGARAGFLTLAAFLAMNAHPTETSPTLRGKYVRERILCELVPPPPPDVVTDIEPADPTMPRTLRERLELHRTSPACAACHAAIDPPGFLFEGFDSVGAVRTHDHGWPVDTSGDLDGEPLRDGRELGEALATDPRVSRCMVRQLFRHAVGRLETDGEEPAIDALHSAFARSGYRFRELMIELAISEALRTTALPGDAAPEVSP